MGPGDKWEDGMWQIINNHLSHCFPCFAVWQSARYRQGAASSTSQDAAAAVTTHMWPKCSGADFPHSRIPCWYTNEIDKRWIVMVQMRVELSSETKKETRFPEKSWADSAPNERGWHEVWSNEKVNENQNLVCIVILGIFLKINNHLTR